MPLNSSFFPSILYNNEYSPLGSTVSRGNGAEDRLRPAGVVPLLRTAVVIVVNIVVTS